VSNHLQPLTTDVLALAVEVIRESRGKPGFFIFGEGGMMAGEPTNMKPDGLPEKIGAAFGLVVIVAVFSGLAWMAARAAGVM
jgi:hypothetical protein